MTKFHVHDCECCHYLGSEEKDKNQYDYYVCEQSGFMPTVIARFGALGDYASGLDFVKYSANEHIKTHAGLTLSEAVLVLRNDAAYQGTIELVEAAARAVEQGFLDENLKFKSLVKKIKP